MQLNASHGNVKFESYKLSRTLADDPGRILSLPGHVAALPGTGFDYLHTRAAALHNHLWCQAGSMLCIVRAQLPERLLVLSFEGLCSRDGGAFRQLAGEFVLTIQQCPPHAPRS